MSDTPFVLCEIEDRMAILTLNRPDKLNALNGEVIQLLHQHFETLAKDDAVGAVILTGAGEKAFAAGADITEFLDLSPAEARDLARAGQALGKTMDEMRKPVIAAVSGFALGGGCEVATACHIRVASESAKFGQPEVSLGLIPGFGGTQRLPRLVGESRALRMVMTGDMIDAKTAESWGLVDVMSEPGQHVEEAKKIAKRILRQGPVAVGLCIEAVRMGGSMPLEEALEFEAALFGVTFSTADKQEGTTAFVEKRKPSFKGR